MKHIDINYHRVLILFDFFVWTQNRIAFFPVICVIICCFEVSRSLAGNVKYLSIFFGEEWSREVIRISWFPALTGRQAASISRHLLSNPLRF